MELAPGVWASPADVRFSFSRSGGPGGQNVNKLNTKAELRIRLEALRGLSARALDRLKQAAAGRITKDGDLLIVAETERTQERNRRECLLRLRALLIAAMKEPKPRRKTRPTKGSTERRLESKRSRSRKKKERRMGNFD